MDKGHKFFKMVATCNHNHNKLPIDNCFLPLRVIVLGIKVGKKKHFPIVKTPSKRK
jgi:hypothetical protein